MNLKQPRVKLRVSGKPIADLVTVTGFGDGTHEFEVLGPFPFRADPYTLRTFRFDFFDQGRVSLRAYVENVKVIDDWGQVKRTIVYIADPKARTEYIEVTTL